MINKLLAVRLDSMGDVLMTTPAFRALKDTYPSLHLTLLTSHIGGGVTPFIPEIDDTIIFDAPWVNTYYQMAEPDDVIQLISILKQRHFDAAVIFTVYSQNPLPAALMLFTAEIPLRLSYAHENPYQLLTHWIADPEPTRFIRHEVQRQLDLVSVLGAKTSNTHLSFSIPSSAMLSIQQLLHQLKLTSKSSNWFILHPGAREFRRRYPINLYQEAISHLFKQWTGKVIVTGNVDEVELGKIITQNIGKNIVNLTGQLNLGELGALIHHAPLIVTNNTGTVHIAAAVDTPILDIYARTNSQHIPWQIPHQVLYFDVPCKDCARGVCTVKHHLSATISPRLIATSIHHFLTRGKDTYAATKRTHLYK